MIRKEIVCLVVWLFGFCFCFCFFTQMAIMWCGRSIGISICVCVCVCQSFFRSLATRTEHLHLFKMAVLTEPVVCNRKEDQHTHTHGIISITTMMMMMMVWNRRRRRRKRKKGGVSWMGQHSLPSMTLSSRPRPLDPQMTVEALWSSAALQMLFASSPTLLNFTVSNSHILCKVTSPPPSSSNNNKGQIKFYHTWCHTGEWRSMKLLLFTPNRLHFWS